MSGMLFDSMEPYVKMAQTTIEDAGGGYTTGWTDALSFKGFVRKEQAPEIDAAGKTTVKEMLTVVVPSDVVLSYHDVIRRVSDGAIFRLTSNTADDKALAIASIQIAKANCERWVLT